MHGTGAHAFPAAALRWAVILLLTVALVVRAAGVGPMAAGGWTLLDLGLAIAGASADNFTHWGFVTLYPASPTSARQSHTPAPI